MCDVENIPKSLKSIGSDESVILVYNGAVSEEKIFLAKKKDFFVVFAISSRAVGGPPSS